MFARNRTSARLRLVGELRLEVAEHVQLRVVGVGGVEVVLVVALPEERLAALDLSMSSVLTPALVQHRVLVVAEVVAHRADHAHVGEEARREREVHGRAAEHPLALAEGRLDRVEGDRSHHREAHRRRSTIAWRARASAIQINEFGGPEVLEVVEDAPDPEPGDGEVLIEVSRAGINFADTHQRENTTSRSSSCRCARRRGGGRDERPDSRRARVVALIADRRLRRVRGRAP